MQREYLSPIIERRLIREFVDERVLINPRINEIQTKAVNLAAKMGNVFMYRRKHYV